MLTVSDVLGQTGSAGRDAEAVEKCRKRMFSAGARAEAVEKCRTGMSLAGARASSPPGHRGTIKFAGWKPATHNAGGTPALHGYLYAIAALQGPARWITS